MKMRTWIHLPVSVQVILLTLIFSVSGQDTIPRKGMLLWVAADSVEMNGTEVAKLIDMSGKNNSPTHCTDVPNISTVPSILKNPTEYNGHGVLHFPGSYTGFSFKTITGIRAVFIVILKDSTSCHPLAAPGSCCQDQARFWMGGMDGNTNFHGDHGCCIFRNDTNEASPCLVTHGFASINGGPNIHPALTHMPFKLGLVTLLASCPVQASTIARDRTDAGRSWQGDIAEILLYDNVLDTPTVKSIQNILMGKYGIDGHKPVVAVKQNGFARQRDNSSIISSILGNRQSIRLALAGKGTYSLSLNNTLGQIVFRKNGNAPETVTINKAQFPAGFYYLAVKTNNAVAHRFLTIER